MYINLKISKSTLWDSHGFIEPVNKIVKKMLIFLSQSTQGYLKQNLLSGKFYT